MIIRRKDLEFLRKLELGIDLIKKLPDQIAKFEKTKVIDSFGIRFFLPPLIGGKWYFVLSRISGVTEDVINKLEFPVEMGVNISIPDGLLPEITVSYYTQDPEKEELVLKGQKPAYIETKILNEYDYPICLPLSQEEIKIVEILLQTPLISIKDLATELNLSPATIRAKLSRLQLDKNRKGMLMIVPSINWSKIENFIHLHIGVETGISQEMVNERIKDLKLASAGWFRGTIYQLEFDLWEPADLTDILEKLKQIRDIKLVGLLIAKRSIVIDSWLADLMKKF
ncbi:MAG TPA: winged helix-turn-helix domain-containing protein [bacterium (Candidatus Stahlbacteria)]|nr:winged helix-turn-helix domain-containing protein [Candidatus Stahlbacteria bacterium]